jgi:hypothetical protein
MKLPVPGDAHALAARLAAEERDLVERLATLEARVRRFADVERPAYESWRRLEFGPLLATLQELSDQLRLRGILAHRLQDLVERDGLHPREALYMVENPDAWPARAPGGGFDPDEVEARRRAKRDRRRAERREAKRAKRIGDRTSDDAAASGDAAADTTRPAARVVDLYRALARRIHPDSPAALRTVAPDRLGALWTDVQDAYESGSLERLLALAAWVDTLSAAEGAAGDDHAPSPSRADAAHPTGRGALLSFSERYDRLRALRRSLRALERDLAALEGDPAWEFAARRRDDARRLARATRDAIEADVARVRDALAELDAFFRDVGPPRPPRFARRR